MTGGFYFGAVLDSITRVAADLGHSVIALQTLAAGLDSGEEHAPAFLRLPVAQHQVGGYICVTNSLPHDDLAQITAAGKPLVLISAEPEGLAVPVTLPDNAGGVAAAVEHLVGHGHRRIGFVGHLWLTDVRERYAAYTAAMLMHGITPEASWLFEASDNLEEGGAHAARLMISESIPTTAVIVATDRNAAGLIRALRTAGMDLPDDQAIVGFDNAELGLRLSPSLTTVDQHIDRMAALAAQLVLSQMRGEIVAPAQYRSPVSLVVRESCGCTRSRTELDTDEDAGPGLPRQRFLSAVRLAVGAFPGSPGMAQDLTAAPALALAETLESTGVLGRWPERTARIVKALYALAPYEESVTALVKAVRRFEHDLLATIPSDTAADARRVALYEAATDVFTALGAVQGRELRWRIGRLEASLAYQYEIDMDLLKRGRDDPRTLSWLPKSRVRAACLGLWTGGVDQQGQRLLEIVGVHDPSRRMNSLVGRTVAPHDFPPASMCDAGPQRAHNAVFIVSVAIEGSDWGLLAVVGHVESRGTSARDNYNHWAALLSVALDEESLQTAQRRQQRDLAEAYRREQTLVRDLQLSQERYVMAADAATDGLWDWDVAAGTVFYSSRWAALLGLDLQDLRDEPAEWLDRVHPEDSAAVSTAIAAQLAGRPGIMDIEHRLRTVDGSYRWVLCRARTVIGGAGSPSRLVGAITDVTDRRQLEDQLRRGALYDVGTELPNRVLFHDRLDRALGIRRDDPAYAVSVVLLRAVPSTLAHLGRRLQGGLPARASVGWLGSGDLGILLEGDDAQKQSEVAADLRHQLATEVSGNADGAGLISCGVAVATTRHHSASEVLQDAHADLLRTVARHAPR